VIKAKQIPDEVFEAFQKAWAVTSTLSTKECLAAAINAWPGMEIEMVFVEEDYLILPLTQENNNGSD
jgi:hypothetical protein